MFKLTKSAKNLADNERLCPRCSGCGFWLEKGEMCFRCRGVGKVEKSTVSQTESTCAKCGCELGGEAAQVGNEVWCHPCADTVAQTSRVDTRMVLKRLHLAVKALGKIGSNNVTLFEDSPLKSQEAYDAWKKLNDAQADAAKALKFKLLFDNEWLRAKIATDPELDCEAGTASQTSQTCVHAAIIGLDGKWHCQKCAAAIEMGKSQTHQTGGE